MVQVTCSGGIAKAEDAKLKWRRNSPEARPNGKGEWRSWTKERELGVWENTKVEPTMGRQSSSRLVEGANVANDPVDTMSSTGFVVADRTSRPGRRQCRVSGGGKGKSA